jgi:hypothetical protein
MLDSMHREQELAAWIRSLTCHVVLPPKLRDDFEKSGHAPTVYDEVRSGARIYCRGIDNLAAIETRHHLPAFPRKAEWNAVYTTNISKKGCGFLHSEILYPGEQFALVLSPGIHRMIEIVWCRRIDKKCFEVGSRFVATLPTSAAKE